MRDRSPRQVVAMSALAVALSAKARTLDALDVGALQVRAEQLLDHADPLFLAISHFCTMYELHRRDPVALAETGQTLLHRIDVVMQPAPPDLDRRDIHA